MFLINVKSFRVYEADTDVLARSFMSANIPATNLKATVMGNRVQVSVRHTGLREFLSSKEPKEEERISHLISTTQSPFSV